MVEQPEILKHDPDTPPDGRQVPAPSGSQFGAKQGYQAARRRFGDIDELELGGFARPRQAGQEGERAWLQRETDIAQHFRPGAIAHADIFKANHGPNIPMRQLAVMAPGPYFSYVFQRAGHDSLLYLLRYALFGGRGEIPCRRANGALRQVRQQLASGRRKPVRAATRTGKSFHRAPPGRAPGAGR